MRLLRRDYEMIIGNFIDYCTSDEKEKTWLYNSLHDYLDDEEYD